MVSHFSVLIGNLAVLHSPGAGNIGLEGEIMLGKRSRVDHFAPKVLCDERLVLVGGDHQVREGVEVEGAVKVPVDGAGVERQGGEVALAGDGLGEMSRYVASVGKVKSVSAQFGHNVLPEDDNLLSAVLHPGWVAQELGTWDKPGEILSDVGGQRRSRENWRRPGVCRPWYQVELRVGDQRRELGNHFTELLQVVAKLAGIV